MKGWLTDVRYAWRLLLKSPVFTLSAIMVLGVGIGASTAVFSVADHILFRPLGIQDAHRVVTVCETHESLRGVCVASTPNVLDWADRSRTLDAIGAARTDVTTLRTEDGPRLVTTGIGTPGFLRALGLR